ncbi:hypothetical protein L7F22_020954 [Adiantum nelumboides]|nr:hypothetical protein [Adiantum nelumboides]
MPLDEQYNTFHRFGYGADPSAEVANNTISNGELAKANDTNSVYNLRQSEHRKQKARRKAKKKEDQSDEEMDAETIENTQNSASELWLLKNSKSPWSGKKKGLQTELTKEQKKYAKEYALKKSEKEKGDNVEIQDKSTFHGKEEHDYQGRSWIAPPKDVKASNDHCYIPKRWVHS